MSRKQEMHYDCNVLGRMIQHQLDAATKFKEGERHPFYRTANVLAQLLRDRALEMRTCFEELDRDLAIYADDPEFMSGYAENRKFMMRFVQEYSNACRMIRVTKEHYDEDFKK